MDTLYMIALVIGGVLLVLSLVGDQLGLDMLSTDLETGDLHIFTIRGATYFLFVFGALGVALPRWAGAGSITTAALATGSGLAVATLAGRLFAYLRATDSGEVETDSSLHGLQADVIIPIRSRADGKVSVQRGTERLELLARPFDDSDGDPSAWRHVRIIDVRDGTALVAPASPES